MCQKPLTKDGNTFSCNRCDDCVAARRIDWTSRALAERQMHKHALVYTLTYGNDTQEQRDGAAMFRYADIQGLLKRVRRAIHYRTGQNDAVRFICAGEQGSRHGRCHWHIVLFSDFDLRAVGTYTGHTGATIPPEGVSTAGRQVRRLRWSLWPHGLITVQEPDEGGIAYALKYALKDQFSLAKSEGTMRMSKAEAYATGFFRMSKRPPIGWRWIEKRLQEWEAQGAIPSQLLLRIPDVSLRWYPRGSTRAMLLHGLRDINDRIRDKTGANAPQWSSLLHHCRENLGDMEILLNVEETETEESEALLLRKKADFQRDEYERKKVATRCGSSVACSACLRGADPAALAAAGIELCEDASGETFFAYRGEATSERLRAAQGDRANGGVNSLCGLRATEYVARVFTQSARNPAFGNSPKSEKPAR